MFLFEIVKTNFYYFVGYQIELKDIERNGKPLIMETISLEPRMFKLKGFLTDNEAGS
jgi:hypothetical protein